eukprot:jgi/Botrbrau1/14826/Bobra.168_3s0008.1
MLSCSSWAEWVNEDPFPNRVCLGIYARLQELTNYLPVLVFSNVLYCYFYCTITMCRTLPKLLLRAWVLSALYLH